MPDLITLTLTTHINMTRILGHSLLLAAAPFPEDSPLALWRNADYNELLNTVADAPDMANWFSRLTVLLTTTASHPNTSPKAKSFLTMLAMTTSDLAVGIGRAVPSPIN